ncbi:hypothetical protein JXA12_03575 [Candidatus Woesearchaeota archaeon]|nr:hypothetical protein [Candidatus Woesearchaeota archaeon]
MARDKDISPPVILEREEEEERSQKPSPEPPEEGTDEEAPAPPKEIAATGQEEEAAPTPPKETAGTEDLEEEAAPTPPKETAGTEEPEEEPPNTKDLEDSLDRLAGERHDRPKPIFTVLGGKRAITLSDLLKVVKQMTAEEYARHQADGDVAHWARTHLFDDDLAAKLKEAQDQRAAINIIEATLRPHLKKAREEPRVVDKEGPAERFAALQEEHRKSMEALQEAVKTKDRRKLTTKTIRNVITLKNEKTPASLEELFAALELLDENTYEDVKTNKKEDLLAWIKELAAKAAKAGTLNPIQLQSRLAQDISAYDNKITDRIEQERRVNEEEAEVLVKKEDELSREREELERIKEQLALEERRLEQQQETVGDELREREERVAQQEEKQESFLEEQRRVVEELKRREEELASTSRKQEEALREKQERMRRLELEFLERKKALEAEIADKEARTEEIQAMFDKREAEVRRRERAFAADKEAYEQGMVRREQLVQETIDKILTIDQDVNEQRKHIERMKQDIDNEAFQEYLKSRLKEVRTDHIPFKEVPKPDLRKKHALLFAKIGECNRAAEAKDFRRATEAYNELKSLFEQEKLTQEEKDILYDAIRELYASIHLAMLDH